MRRYLYSLIPFRWTIILVFILLTEYIIMIGSFPEIYHFLNIVTWFVVDYTIGLGRYERSVQKNIAGLTYLAFILALLVRQMHN